MFPSWEVTNCYRNEYSGVVCTPHSKCVVVVVVFVVFVVLLLFFSWY